MVEPIRHTSRTDGVAVHGSSAYAVKQHENNSAGRRTNSAQGGNGARTTNNRADLAARADTAEHAPTGRRGQPSISNTGTAVVDVLAESLSALARDLEQHDDTNAMLAAIVAAAVATVPGAEDGSISVIAARRRVTSEAATSQLPIAVDAIQQQVQQGPCLDAAYTQQTVRVDDLATETRWPLFAPRASDTGAASTLSLQLFVEGANLGALNLFSRTPQAFTDESEQIGLLVAAHAAIAYVGVKNKTGLAAALDNRDLIGQAKGILIERYKIDSDQAFLLLTRVSQHSNRKLHDIAHELVHHGTIATRK